MNDLAVAVATAALRSPAFVIDWLAGAPEANKTRTMALLHEGFGSLEEDFAEEQFFVAARAAYWDAPEDSPRRPLAATLIDTLEF
jgi:hypothetical protein